MKCTLLFLLFITGCFYSPAQPVVGFSSVPNTAGLTKVLDIVNAKDGTNRLFFVQQNGIIRVYSAGALLPAEFLNISSIITFDNMGERGLLSLVFHPAYATNRYFFVYYNNTAGNVVLAQYRTLAANPNVADPASGKVLLTITKPFSNHNGCKLNFGPDGNLYFATGDGGSGGDPGNRAQNPGVLLGKMLRINVDNFTDDTLPYYDIPPTNPFVGVTGYLPEIYALGLRNPWRWSFDRQNNNMWLADVGQIAWEEVNFLPYAQTSGVNYGWRCYEAMHEYNIADCGTTPAAGKVVPIFEYPHNNTYGGFSITGGYVYRGTEFPGLQGYYICSDYVTTNGWLVQPDGNGAATALQQSNFPVHISCFGEAEDGTLYAGSLDGPVYKVNLVSLLPVKLLSFSGRHQNGFDLLQWTTTVDPSLSRFEIEQSDNGTRFTTVGSQLPKNNGNTAAYAFSVLPGAVDTRFYRIKMIYADGNIQYSAIVKIGSRQLQQVTVSYNGARQIQLNTPYDLKMVYLFDMTGHKIAEYANVKAGNRLLNTGTLVNGMYVVKCTDEDGRQQQLKILIQ